MNPSIGDLRVATRDEQAWQCLHLQEQPDPTWRMRRRWDWIKVERIWVALLPSYFCLLTP